jgi:hypothetical protein
VNDRARIVHAVLLSIGEKGKYIAQVTVKLSLNQVRVNASLSVCKCDDIEMVWLWIGCCAV